MTAIQVADVRYPVRTLGPGVRVAIWFQGCHIGCPGCVSRDTWTPSGGKSLTVKDLVSTVVDLVDGPLQGITISGGEPFEQPEALTALVDQLRSVFERRADPVDVLCYSGITLRDLETRFPHILARLDALVPEPYRARTPTELPWRGSANQPLLALSPLGRARYQHIAAAARSIQLDVAEGHVELIGIPRRGDLARVARHLAAAGITLQDTTWRP